MKSILEKISDAGDSVMYMDQPSTMSDQIQPVAEGLGLDVIKITPEFMLHGLGDCTPERHCGCLSEEAERVQEVGGSEGRPSGRGGIADGAAVPLAGTV